MRRLSEAAGLSQTYTNHCLRVTSISLMKRAGLEDRKIMAVSGHRNVQSLQSHDRPSAADASVAAAAIDLKPVASPVSASHVHVKPVPFPSDKENVVPGTSECSSDFPIPSGICVYGSSNVTISYSHLPPGYPPARPAPPRNPRLPLKLKRKSAESTDASCSVLKKAKGDE